MATLKDFLYSAGVPTNAGGYAWWLPDGSMTTDPNVYANTPNQLYGGKTPTQYISGLGVDPTNMGATVPDPLKGNMFQDSIGGLSVLALPLLAAGGAAAFGGATAAEGAAGSLAGTLGGGGAALTPWEYGPLAGGGSGLIDSAALGGIDAGLGALEGGISAADAAAGMVPEFGTPAAYGAGIGNAAYGGLLNAGASTGGLMGAASPLLSSGAGTAKTLAQYLSQATGIPEWGIDAAGRAIPGLVGAYASNQQTDAIKDLANKYSEYGAPYRQRLSDLYANPSSFLSSPEVQVPVQQGTDALARSLSAKVGNPIENMTALQDIQNYSANQLFGKLGQEKDRLAGFGGLSNYNQAAPGLEQNAIASNANFWNALGSATNNVFNPPSSLEQLLKGLKGSNVFTGY